MLQSLSTNSLQTSSLDNILLGNFTLSNSIILMEDLIRSARGFEIFLIDHYADIGNENMGSKYQRIVALVSPILYMTGQFT